MGDYKRDSEGRWIKTPSGLIVPSTFGAHLFLAGPLSGADATPTLRAIDSSDLPEATDSARGGIVLTEDLDGSATAPQVKQARGLRSSGGVRYPIGALPSGGFLRVVSGSIVGWPLSAGGGSLPAGHDVSALSNVVSHWQILDAVQGSTSVPDALGAHNGTAAASIKTTGRPWYGSEGQASLAQLVDLANSSALQAELRDASCAFMCWAMVERPTSDTVLFVCNASGETSATNHLLQAAIMSTGVMRMYWEHSSGTDVSVSGPKVAAGLRHLCWAREHNTGSGTSTAHLWIDGIRVLSTSGLTNPSGGGSTTGKLWEIGADVCLSDCLLISGSIPSDAQVLAQYQRGHGSY
jgi:hypothetical protein